MPAHKCSYFSCKNTSKEKSLFSFPWRHPDRLKEWLENCGNFKLASLPAKNLKSRYICIDHFKPKHLRKETGQRKRLKRNAIPEPYDLAKTKDRGCSPMPDYPKLFENIAQATLGPQSQQQSITTTSTGAIRTYKRTSSSLPQASAPKKSYITLDATSNRLVIQAAASTSVESSQTHEEASEFKPGITSNLQETRPQQGSRASKKSNKGSAPKKKARTQ